MLIIYRQNTNLAVAVQPETRLPFTTRTIHDAIDVFDRSALLELRRAARLQSVLRPASRDQIRWRAVRQRQSSTVRQMKAKASKQQQCPNDKLPSYIRPLRRVRSARPSTTSSEPASDASGQNPIHLEASRSIFSSRYMQNRHRR